MKLRSIGIGIIFIVLASVCHAQTCGDGLCFAQVNPDSITSYSGSGSSIAGTVPANTTNHLMFAFVAARFAGFSPTVSITPPAGWTPITAGPADSTLGFGPYEYIVSAVYLRRGTGTTFNATWMFNRSADNSRLVFGVLDNTALTNWESSSAAYITNVSSLSMTSVGPAYATAPGCLVLLFSAATYDSGMQSSDLSGVLSSVNGSEVAIWADVQDFAGWVQAKRIWFMSGSGSNGPTSHILLVIKPR